ncbi:hypothetical protein AWJ20_4251 [Sugiyamaella lignohabitans]|uniref:Uncharacterized protein n=1 Tax=Sugiyamaella lignohabitans TaxID=796027 RepID=A0A161HFR3_9ASCO|nr:uncharacterized protein AWJ20_4251 [Sugiyamaella lignohabitans]ANB11441.1 hypothetical protein AWJ20_4251 [Sugiyamaella lignohabitans]
MLSNKLGRKSVSSSNEPSHNPTPTIKIKQELIQEPNTRHIERQSYMVKLYVPKIFTSKSTRRRHIVYSDDDEDEDYQDKEYKDEEYQDKEDVDMDHCDDSELKLPGSKSASRGGSNSNLQTMARLETRHESKDSVSSLSSVISSIPSSFSDSEGIPLLLRHTNLMAQNPDSRSCSSSRNSLPNPPPSAGYADAHTTSLQLSITPSYDSSVTKGRYKITAQNSKGSNPLPSPPLPLPSRHPPGPPPNKLQQPTTVEEIIKDPLTTKQLKLYEKFLKSESLHRNNQIRNGMTKKFPLGSRIFFGHPRTVSKQQVWQLFYRNGRIFEIFHDLDHSLIQYSTRGDGDRAILQVGDLTFRGEPIGM